MPFLLLHLHFDRSKFLLSFDVRGQLRTLPALCPE
jgi:hypothetical protein